MGAGKKPRTKRKPVWVDVKVAGAARILRSDDGRVFEATDVGGEEKLRKYPDPPPVKPPATKRRRR